VGERREGGTPGGVAWPGTGAVGAGPPIPAPALGETEEEPPDPDDALAEGRAPWIGTAATGGKPGAIRCNPGDSMGNPLRRRKLVGTIVIPHSTTINASSHRLCTSIRLSEKRVVEFEQGPSRHRLNDHHTHKAHTCPRTIGVTTNHLATKVASAHRATPPPTMRFTTARVVDGGRGAGGHPLALATIGRTRTQRFAPNSAAPSPRMNSTASSGSGIIRPHG
jgi:hypothetical protein